MVILLSYESLQVKPCVVYFVYFKHVAQVNDAVISIKIYLSSFVCMCDYFVQGIYELERNTGQRNLGHAVVSGLEFSCHGFTEFMLQERVEYAWMMRLNLGKIFGSASVEQVCCIAMHA